MDIAEKIKILSSSAKYDVSCSSSGSSRQNTNGGLGNAVYAGICHSFTDDGRCISLLKTLYTNNCIYDCAYCINRKSNDIKRAAFTVKEIVDLTINFYRRNYIEGLFLSSGVVRNPDFTMQQLAQVAKELRTIHRFNGYIHLKAIPGASEESIRNAGFYADRLSVNIEIPSEQNLKKLAPEKNFSGILQPMNYLNTNILENKEDRRKFRKTPMFVPAGQSTQLIIGATPDSDLQILSLASGLYSGQNLKRVYYSAYLHVNTSESKLPALPEPPKVRENRLYQADWLLRLYGFGLNEIIDEKHQNLDVSVDPKLGFALRNPQLFPVDINKADYEMIVRVPGIGIRSAKLIVLSRRFGKLGFEQLKKMGVVLKRAKYFIRCNELAANNIKDVNPFQIRKELMSTTVLKRHADELQLKLF